MSSLGPAVDHLPLVKLCESPLWLAARLPRRPAGMFDSPATVSNRSHVVPAWQPLSRRQIELSAQTFTVRSWSGLACHPLWAPRLDDDVRPMESAIETQVNSSPRRSPRPIASMQAMPSPPNA